MSPDASSAAPALVCPICRGLTTHPASGGDIDCLLCAGTGRIVAGQVLELYFANLGMRTEIYRTTKARGVTGAELRDRVETTWLSLVRTGVDTHERITRQSIETLFETEVEA